jgi:[acyl-carrier-protein] S-malonyltransferase
MPVVLMFPGQTSRSAGMLERVLALHPEGRRIVELACELLGRDLLHHYAAEDGGFGANRDIQVGVFLVNHLYLQALASAGVRAVQSLGLSLGEYNHLVHAGALAFEDALQLVEQRGRLYDQGPAGIMAAVFPLAEAPLRQVLARVAHLGVVEVANLNSPLQHVIAGDAGPVAAASAILSDEHDVEPVIIEQHIPMHCSRFAAVAEAFRPALQAVPWRRPTMGYLANVAGQFVEAPQPRVIADLLCRHVCSPVLWRQSLEAAAARIPGAVFVETGPRSVLFNLMGRRWLCNEKYKLDTSAAEFARTVQRLRSVH